MRWAHYPQLQMLQSHITQCPSALSSIHLCSILTPLPADSWNGNPRRELIMEDCQIPPETQHIDLLWHHHLEHQVPALQPSDVQYGIPRAMLIWTDEDPKWN